MMDDSNADKTLLHVATAHGLDELSTAVSQSALSPIALLSAVPETTSANDLASVLRQATESDTTEILGTEQWAASCVARAESIDLCTGRLDWAVSWLEAALSLTTGAQQVVERALANARILDAVIALGGDDTKELSDVNRMSDLELVQWTVELAEADLAMIEVLDIVCAEANVRDAWNTWWAKRVDVAGAPFVQLVFGRYAELFDSNVVLAAVYAIGGGCSSLDGARIILPHLAKALGVEEASQSVHFATDVLQKFADASAHILIDELQGLSEGQVCGIVGAGLAQIRALELLALFGLVTDLPVIVACQGRVEDQRRVLIRLLASAQRSATTESVSLWETVLSLHSLDLFSCLSVDDLKQEYLRSLLNSEEFDQARDLINAPPQFIDEAVVRDIVCQCVSELFDNAESGNMDGGLMRAAQQCLDILPAQWQDDPAVQHERQLIDAAHLTWTLQQSGSSIFNRGRGADSGVLPIEIRLAADLYELIKCILDRQPQGYKKPRIVKEIANKLRGVNESKGLRNLGVGSVSDAFVTGLLLDAATAQRDYSAAYEFARQLGNARAVLDQALKAVEAYHSAQLLHEARAGIERPVEVRAVEQAWTACVRLADAWGDSNGVGEKRLEVISLALSLCPTGKIPELLKLWNQVQTDVLDSRAEVLLPWVESASAEASILDVMVGSQHEVAEDQGQRSVAGESVDFETMRTFDPAIIKSSLRQASDAGTRCDLLMEWLEFAMTTAKEPKTDKAAAYKARVEAEVVQKHTAKACEVLADRVALQLDQTNYFAMETFYAFLARCLERNGDSEGAEQAGVRAELARRIRGVEALDSLEFSVLIGLVTGPRIELGDALNVHSVSGIAGLVPLFVQLRHLPAVDAERKTEAVAWDPSEMTSLLYLHVLDGILDQITRSSSPGLLTAQFVALLADYLPQMQPKDISGLVDRLAFEHSVASRIEIASRLEAVHLCAEHAGSVADLGLSLVEFIGTLSDIRDPFTFGSMPDDWVGKFDALEIDKGDATMLGSKCVDILVGMIGQHVPAYFVCQAYLLVVGVVHKWSADEAVPELADIYVRALDNAVDLAGQLAGERVQSIAEPPLELCTFNYGDDSLGNMLKQFKQEFGTQLADAIHGRRSGSALSSSTRLVLLEIYRRHYPESPRASMLSIDRSAAAGRQSVDISDADLLQFQLLADKYWARDFKNDEGRKLGERCAIWKQLLGQSTTDEQIDTLAGLLAQWHSADQESADVAACAAQLLGWAVRSKKPQRAVVAVLAHSACFTSLAGDQAFEQLLEETQQDPMLAGPLALLALAYPDQAWAERCLESAIYVMMMAPASESEIEGTESSEEPGSGDGDEEDDEDPWGIEDVEIGDDEEAGAEKDEEKSGPSPAELFAARTAILTSPALHVAIMIRGFVPASLASPALLDALESTLMYQRRAVASDPACQALLGALIQTSHLAGTAPIDELFRRTVHTMSAVGMEDRALLWIYEYFGISPVQRFAARAGTVKRWLGHLDRVLLGEEYERRDEAQKAGGGALAVDAEDDAGWGESDVDLDEEIGVPPAAKEPEQAVKPTAKELGAEPTAVAKAEDDHDDDDEGGWGDDGSDIDLDADLERL